MNCGGTARDGLAGHFFLTALGGTERRVSFFWRDVGGTARPDTLPQRDGTGRGARCCETIAGQHGGTLFSRRGGAGLDSARDAAGRWRGIMAGHGRYVLSAGRVGTGRKNLKP